MDAGNGRHTGGNIKHAGGVGERITAARGVNGRTGLSTANGALKSSERGEYAAVPNAAFRMAIEDERLIMSSIHFAVGVRERHRGTIECQEKGWSFLSTTSGVSNLARNEKREMPRV